MPEKINKAIFLMLADYLVELLQLPKDAKIVYVEKQLTDTRVMFIIEHADLPETDQKHALPMIRPTVTTEQRYVINWDFTEKQNAEDKHENKSNT